MDDFFSLSLNVWLRQIGVGGEDEIEAKKRISEKKIVKNTGTL